MLTTTVFDWRRRYENMVALAAEGWYIDASKTQRSDYYVYHRPAKDGAWGCIVIANDNPTGTPYTDGVFELSTPERIPFGADRRAVRHFIKKLSLPVIGD